MLFTLVVVILVVQVLGFGLLLFGLLRMEDFFRYEMQALRSKAEQLLEDQEEIISKQMKKIDEKDEDDDHIYYDDGSEETEDFKTFLRNNGIPEDKHIVKLEDKVVNNKK